MRPLFMLCDRVLAEVVDSETSTDLAEFAQRKFDYFFFRFKSLLNDLLHISSVRHVAFNLGVKPPAFRPISEYRAM